MVVVFYKIFQKTFKKSCLLCPTGGSFDDVINPILLVMAFFALQFFQEILNVFTSKVFLIFFGDKYITLTSLITFIKVY